MLQGISVHVTLDSLNSSEFRLSIHGYELLMGFTYQKASTSVAFPILSATRYFNC